MEPGRIAKGKQIKTNVMQSGDIALFTSKWSLEGASLEGNKFSNENIATSVFRKNFNGKWRLVINNSFGPEVLNK